MPDYQVGDCVVLMDANLRGRITAIGRRVRIELEDGLEIEASPCEFVVTQSEEMTTLQESPLQSKVASSHKNSAIPKKIGSQNRAITVDLHIEQLPGGNRIPQGKQLQYQMDAFHRILRQHLIHRGMRISFIHGIGDGILKTTIRKELRETYALRSSYNVGDPAVTVVTIK